jgi:hypothetical protein
MLTDIPHFRQLVPLPVPLQAATTSMPWTLRRNDAPALCWTVAAY